MTFHRTGLVSFVGWTVSGVAILAATFADRTATPSGKSPPASVIRMTGMIEDGDARRLRTMLTELRSQPIQSKARPLATVEMSSIGGDLLEGMKLGYLFREFGVATVVRAGDSCLSSCALAFLGGAERKNAVEVAASRVVEVGGSLGFHNFYLNPNHERARDAATPTEGIARGFNDAKGAAALLVHYAASLGVDADFIARMLGRPPESWDYAETAGMFIDLKICPGRLERPMPALPVRAANICANTLGEASRGDSAEVRPLSPSEARRLLLRHVQKNVAATGLRSPLAAQLAAVTASRDDKAVDAAYADFRAAGLSLPEILGPTFEVKGLGAGAYELSCVVSLSPDDPDRFDLVLESPGDLIRPPRQAPPACGRVLGFERGEIINPTTR